MTTTTMTGPWTKAPNLSADSKGSIHDDAAARAVGFEAALVGGSVLLAFETPALTELFGTAWYQRGFLKQSFVSPIYEATELRTYAERSVARPQTSASWSSAWRSATASRRPSATPG